MFKIAGRDSNIVGILESALGIRRFFLLLRRLPARCPSPTRHISALLPALLFHALVIACHTYSEATLDLPEHLNTCALAREPSSDRSQILV